MNSNENFLKDKNNKYYFLLLSLSISMFCVFIPSFHYQVYMPYSIGVLAFVLSVFSVLFVSFFNDIHKTVLHQIHNVTKKYKEQKNIAEKAAQIKEDFLANMSHELRTPLNSIIGLTKILLDEGKFNQDESEALNIIENSSHTLLKTVNDILDISKIEAGKVNLESKSFNISEVLTTLIDQIKPLADQKGLEIKENLSDMDDVYVKADSYRISKIITNLLGNAVQYTHDGHIKIKLQVEDKNDKQTDFIIMVSDTGIGISAEKQETIFNEFSQAEDSTERVYGGTGLGLSITQKLVNLMKGVISVDSKIGDGTTFTVKLPLLKSTQEEATKEIELNTNIFVPIDQKDKLHISKAKILIAEDHEFNKIFIQRILKRMGNSSFTIFSNGVEVLESFKNNDYDVVFMDCHMPKMDGYETTQQIRQYEQETGSTNLTPILAMTADIMPGTKQKCLNVGMDDYIAKPIDEAGLKEKIQKWFNVFDYQESMKGNVSKVSESRKNVSINLALLDEYTNNNTEDKKNLIRIFYDKSLEDLEVLENNCLDGANSSWVESSHSLKGSSGYIGAKTLKNMCSIGQSMADSTKEERLDICKKIKEEHKKICDFLVSQDLLDRRST